ncbi:MAG: hypothetical protein QXL19_08425 [Ignisphaera sp.]
MVARTISMIPSYLLSLVILTIVGVITSIYFIKYYLPLTNQDFYIGSAIKYNYKIENNMITINIANLKEYSTKVDIFLITIGNKVLTTCNGFMYYYTKSIVTSGALELLGIHIDPNEIVTIICYEQNIRNVKVFEYGIETYNTTT